MKLKWNRFLSILLLASLLAGMLSSCDKEAVETTPAVTTEEVPVELTPYEAYQAAVSVFEQADNYKVSYQFSLALKGKNDPAYAPVKKETASESRNGKNMTCKISSGNQTVELSHINGMMYSNDGSTKAKAKMTWDEFVKKFEYERPEVIEVLPGGAFFSSVTVIDDPKGETMRFKLNSGEMKAMAGNLREFLQLGSASDTAKFTTGSYDVYFDEEGKIYKTAMEMNFTVTYREQPCEGVVFVDTTIAYGKANVKAPVNTDVYVDITGRI